MPIVTPHVPVMAVKRLPRNSGLGGGRHSRPAAMRPPSVPCAYLQFNRNALMSLTDSATSGDTGTHHTQAGRKSVARCARDADAGGNRPGQRGAPNRALEVNRKVFHDTETT